MKIHEKKESAKLKLNRQLYVIQKNALKLKNCQILVGKNLLPQEGIFGGTKPVYPPKKKTLLPPPLLTRIVYVCKRLTISIFCIICVFVFKLCDAHVAIKKWPGEYSIPPKVIF